jgi:FkbM family methyltransferase
LRFCTFALVETMKEKVAFWISQQRKLPYRFRKSFVKRVYPKILSDYQFEINFHGLKYAGNTKDNTDRMFFLFGGDEKYMLSFMRDYRLITKNNDFVFVDVGANVGSHTMFMAKYASKVHAFEPNRIVREAMNSNLYINAIENVIVHPIGLGNTNEKLPFYASRFDHHSFGSFCNEHQVGNEYIEDITVRVGDEVLKSRNVDRVDLIKIDAGGYERAVIEGLKNTIEVSRPLVIIELSKTTRKSLGSKDDFESIFPKSYAFFQFSQTCRENDKYKLIPYNYASDEKRIEVVAIPKEKSVYLDAKIIKK